MTYLILNDWFCTVVFLLKLCCHKRCLKTNSLVLVWTKQTSLNSGKVKSGFICGGPSLWNLRRWCLKHRAVQSKLPAYTCSAFIHKQSPTWLLQPLSVAWQRPYLTVTNASVIETECVCDCTNIYCCVAVGCTLRSGCGWVNDSCHSSGDTEDTISFFSSFV